MCIFCIRIYRCGRTDAGSSQHGLFTFIEVRTPLYSWHTKRNVFGARSRGHSARSRGHAFKGSGGG